MESALLIRLERITKLLELEILQALNDIVSSPHFRKSKRYPALLEYSVKHTLQGNFALLKERLIGIELFNRPNDYDSNEDPIVRVTAGEVRKRIAQYYREHADTSVIIELPIGSYVADFYQLNPVKPELSTNDLSSSLSLPNEPQDGKEELALEAEVSADQKTAGNKKWWICAATALVVVAALVCLAFWHQREKYSFWEPVLTSSHEVVTVLMGERFSADDLKSPEKMKALDVLAPDHYFRLDHQVYIGHAAAAVDVCSELAKSHRSCRLVSSHTTTLAEIHNKPVVVIGAFDNPWTLRLLADLRFQFYRSAESIPGTPEKRSIIDASHGANHAPWMLDLGNAPQDSKKDYMIIARYYSSVTDSPVIVIAGASGVGTVSAAEIVCNSEKMRTILSSAPKDWKGQNFEAVLQAQVINGVTGHVQTLGSVFW